MRHRRVPHRWRGVSIPEAYVKEIRARVTGWQCKYTAAAGDAMSAPASTDGRRVTLHLNPQATVEFAADQLWPLHGDYARFGLDLESFATEVARRLQTDGYVGYRLADRRITLIPLNAIKRIDFVQQQ